MHDTVRRLAEGHADLVNSIGFAASRLFARQPVDRAVLEQALEGMGQRWADVLGLDGNGLTPDEAREAAALEVPDPDEGDDMEAGTDV